MLLLQAGLFGGLVGHDVDKGLMVAELDEDGEVHLHSSTLDSFENFWKFYVDLGLVSLSLLLFLSSSDSSSISVFLSVSQSLSVPHSVSQCFSVCLTVFLSVQCCFSARTLARV